MQIRQFVFSVIIGLVVIAMAGYVLTGGALFQGELSYEEAAERLPKLTAKVPWREALVTRVAQVQLGKQVDIADLLPNISQYPMVVDPRIGAGDVGVEIFVTTVRSGKGTDGLEVEIAEAFNEENIKLASGKTARVKVRKIASGTGYQYIAGRKYLPDAFSPVHLLWIEMAKSHGLKMTRIRDKTVHSVGGIVMRTDKLDEVRGRHGTVDVKAVINDVVQGELAMGYTNPFHSSTGLNFLVTILSTFADGDEAAMLSPSVVSAFEQFQRGVPFVALTTVHMRDSVRNDGSLDAFILGHQTFSNTPELQGDYSFIPFDVPHDHPLYAIGNLPEEKIEVLELYADYLERKRFKKLAGDYGWNKDVEATMPLPSGDVLIRAQQLWKEKKDAGVPIAAVFVCDVSGSMKGSKLRAVRQSLIGGADFISGQNSIGLVLFNNRVSVTLPIKPFNIRHKGAFIAAAEDMRAEGGTAMYDGITVALQMLLAEREKNADAKLMMFVLTDGKTKDGLDYEDILPVVKGLSIPIYTIGYEADIETLAQLSSIVEAASITAKEGEVGYKIGSMLNAQM